MLNVRIKRWCRWRVKQLFVAVCIVRVLHGREWQKYHKILKISPNPTSDILTIEFDKVISGSLYIYNEIGHLIRSEDLYNVKEYNYNVSELLDGKYHIQFTNDNNIFNAQFIKVK